MLSTESTPVVALSLWRRPWAVALMGIGLLILCCAIAVPNLDSGDSRQRRNEAVAVGVTRKITELQKEHAAASASRGYACDISELQPAKGGEGAEDPLFAPEHTRSGYRFSIRNCAADGHGLHYEVLALPIDPGKSGTRASAPTSRAPSTTTPPAPRKAASPTDSL